MRKRILVRVDANSEIGLGHAVRISNLLEQMPSLDLWVSGRGIVLQDFFPTAQILNEPRTIEDLHRQADSINANGLLIDHPDTAQQVAQLRAMSERPIALIDDYGRIASGHLVINGTILHEYHRYHRLNPADRILAGGPYTLIHPAFRHVKSVETRSSDHLLIVIGSGNESVRWLDFLLDSKPFMNWPHVTVITGRAHPYPKKIENVCSRVHLQHCHALPSSELANYGHSATAALITGGMIVYEFLAAGLPSVVFPQLDNLEKEMSFFSMHNAVINLGPEQGFNARYIHSCLERLRTDPLERACLRTAGQALVDGAGIQRCAEALIETFGLAGRCER